MPLFKIRLAASVDAETDVYVWGTDSAFAQKMAVDQAKKGKLTWRVGQVDAKGAFSTRYTHEVQGGDAKYKEIADRFCAAFGKKITEKYGLPSVCGGTYLVQYNPKTNAIELTATIIGNREIKVSDVPEFDLTESPEKLLGQMMTTFNMPQNEVRELLGHVFSP